MNNNNDNNNNDNNNNASNSVFVHDLFIINTHNHVPNKGRNQ